MLPEEVQVEHGVLAHAQLVEGEERQQGYSDAEQCPHEPVTPTVQRAVRVEQSLRTGLRLADQGERVHYREYTQGAEDQANVVEACLRFLFGEFVGGEDQESQQDGDCPYGQ